MAFTKTIYLPCQSNRVIICKPQTSYQMQTHKILLQKPQQDTNELNCVAKGFIRGTSHEKVYNGQRRQSNGVKSVSQNWMAVQSLKCNSDEDYDSEGVVRMTPSPCNEEMLSPLSLSDSSCASELSCGRLSVNCPQVPISPYRNRRKAFRVPPIQQRSVGQNGNVLKSTELSVANDASNFEVTPMRIRNLPASFYQCPNKPPSYSPALGLLPRSLSPLFNGGTSGSNCRPRKASYKSQIIVKDPNFLDKLFEKYKTEDISTYSVSLNSKCDPLEDCATFSTDRQATSELCVSVEEKYLQSNLLHRESGTSMLPQLMDRYSEQMMSPYFQLTESESSLNSTLLSDMVSCL